MCVERCVLRGVCCEVRCVLRGVCCEVCGVRCVVCCVQAHAARTGHQNFSESTEAIRPLTEEEKKAQLGK